MSATCIWQITWEGLELDGKKIAEGGEITLRAPTYFLAAGALAEALLEIFPGNAEPIGEGFIFRKKENNAPMRVGDSIVEDAVPKVCALYGKEKLKGVG